MMCHIEFLDDQGGRFSVKYLAWCLMANHVHLIAVPARESSLPRGIGEARRAPSPPEKAGTESKELGIVSPELPTPGTPK